MGDGRRLNWDRGDFALPETSSRQDRVVVIGGGLSGLTVAHRIVERAKQARKAVEVVLLEAKDRIGGAIWTNRGDGFTLEGGADSFITNKPWGWTSAGSSASRISSLARTPSIVGRSWSGRGGSYRFPKASCSWHRIGSGRSSRHRFSRCAVSSGC